MSGNTLPAGDDVSQSTVENLEEAITVGEATLLDNYAESNNLAELNAPILPSNQTPRVRISVLAPLSPADNVLAASIPTARSSTNSPPQSPVPQHEGKHFVGAVFPSPTSPKDATSPKPAVKKTGMARWKAATKMMMLTTRVVKQFKLPFMCEVCKGKGYRSITLRLQGIECEDCDGTGKTPKREHLKLAKRVRKMDVKNRFADNFSDSSTDEDGDDDFDDASALTAAKKKSPTRRPTLGGESQMDPRSIKYLVNQRHLTSPNKNVSLQPLSKPVPRGVTAGFLRRPIGVRDMHEDAQYLKRKMLKPKWSSHGERNLAETFMTLEDANMSLERRQSERQAKLEAQAAAAAAEAATAQAAAEAAEAAAAAAALLVGLALNNNSELHRHFADGGTLCSSSSHSDDGDGPPREHRHDRRHHRNHLPPSGYMQFMQWDSGQDTELAYFPHRRKPAASVPRRSGRRSPSSHRSPAGRRPGPRETARETALESPSYEKISPRCQMEYARSHTKAAQRTCRAIVGAPHHTHAPLPPPLETLPTKVQPVKQMMTHHPTGFPSPRLKASQRSLSPLELDEAALGLIQPSGAAETDEDRALFYNSPVGGLPAYNRGKGRDEVPGGAPGAG